MKALLRNIVTVIAAVSGLLLIVSLALVIFGLRPFILTSTSMEPLYPKGSLVWIDTRVQLKDVEVGDVIAYRASPDMLVLHRYVGKNLIAGDANDVAQEVTLDKTNFIGREKFFIPMVGAAVSSLLSKRRVIWLLIGVFIILACIPWKGENISNDKADCSLPQEKKACIPSSEKESD